ncbi:hypothetical protein K501DRAFT_92558 [Backusella circina FSU 941]|nr:hypothetical protein K501DRAFT_92558 [Backusella circina FSU 941]
MSISIFLSLSLSLIHICRSVHWLSGNGKKGKSKGNSNMMVLDTVCLQHPHYGVCSLYLMLFQRSLSPYIG